MWINSKNIFEHKLSMLGRQGQIYIVPTLDGLKLLALNLILLVIGLVYANNYVLLFNFILFCLFLGSMFYTHFNLSGLQLVSAKLLPVHATENGVMALQLKSTTNFGHYFLQVSFRNIHLYNSKQEFSFSFPGNNSSLKVDIPVKARERGVSRLNRIRIETRFPFHLFRAFSYFDINVPVVVYPERRLNKHPREHMNDVSLSGGDEDYFLKSFQVGDAISRIVWKKFAQTGKLITKQVVRSNTSPVILGFSNLALSREQKEEEISSMCYLLYELHSQNVEYGLKLEDLYIEAGHSTHHLAKCLRALAEYET